MSYQLAVAWSFKQTTLTICVSFNIRVNLLKLKY